MALRIPTLKNRTRPSSRPTFEIDRRPPAHRSAFDALFSELATARSHYEDLRTADAPVTERIDARERLNGLRASMAGHRNGRI